MQVAEKGGHTVNRKVASMRILSHNLLALGGTATHLHH